MKVWICCYLKFWYEGDVRGWRGSRGREASRCYMIVQRSYSHAGKWVAVLDAGAVKSAFGVAAGVGHRSSGGCKQKRLHCRTRRRHNSPPANYTNDRSLLDAENDPAVVAAAAAAAVVVGDGGTVRNRGRRLSARWLLIMISNVGT